MRFKTYLIEHTINEAIDFVLNKESIITLTPNKTHDEIINKTDFIIKNKLRYKGQIEYGEKIYLDGDKFITIHDLIKNKYYTFYGSETTLKNLCKIDSRKGARSTPVKELVPMWIFEAYNQNKSYSEEAILKKVDEVIEVQTSYDIGYYQNGIESLKYFKKIGLKDAYSFERPDTYSMNEHVTQIYQIASNLGAGNPDNWNPGDIWFFNKDGKKFVNSIESQVNELSEYTDLLNIEIKNKNIIPMSLKAPNNGPSKLVYMSKQTPFDMKEYPFWKINISMKNTHLSYMAIKCIKSKDFEIYLQAQTPSGSKGPINKASGTLNPKYKPNLSPNLILRKAGKNHGGGSVVSKKDWVKKMITFKTGKPVYRDAPIPGLTTKFPSEISENDFNYYRKFYLKYKPGKMYKATFEDFTPDARKQYVMWGSWMEFYMRNYNETWGETYKFAKGFSQKIFSQYYLIE